jgi:hypothetical protein
MPNPTAPEPLLDPDCRDGKCGSCVGGLCEHGCHSTAPGLRDAIAVALANTVCGHTITGAACFPCRADAVMAVLLEDPGNPRDRMASALRAAYNAHGTADRLPQMVSYGTLADAALSVRWEHSAHLAARVGDAERRAEHAEGEHQVTQDRLAEAGRLRIHLKAQRQEAWLHKTRADEADAAITALRDLRETLATGAKRLTRREITGQLDAALDAPALRALDSKEILSSSASAERDALQARLDQLRAYARWCTAHSVEPEERDILELTDGAHRDDYVALMAEADRTDGGE